MIVVLTKLVSRSTLNGSKAKDIGGGQGQRPEKLIEVTRVSSNLKDKVLVCNSMATCLLSI